MEECIVFGHGAYYKKKREQFLKKHHVLAIIDNHAAVGEQEHGVKVLQPDALNVLPKVPVFIMVSSQYFIKFYHQLRSLEVNSERIRFGVNEAPSANEAEFLFHKIGVMIIAEENGLAINVRGKKYRFNTEEEYKQTIRRIRQKANQYINLLANMPVCPVSRHFGVEFGSAIDRYYIEKFLKENKSMICGDVMEIADSTYTYKFGNNINNAYKLHVDGEEGCLKGNLATGDGLQDNMIDCFICTQTIMFIYEINNVVKNIYRILKPGGTALITVPGISQIVMGDNERWGDYWRFTAKSLQLLLESAFEKSKIKVTPYGNMKTCLGFLYGLCQEDLSAGDFLFDDDQYQLLICAVCKK